MPHSARTTQQGALMPARLQLACAGSATTGGRSFVSKLSSTAPVLVAAATRCGLRAAGDEASGR